MWSRLGCIGINVVRILIMCAIAAVAGCATSVDRIATPARLVAGTAVAAPEGLVDYCRRSPEECGEAARTGDLRGRISATGAASFQTASWPRGGDGASVFQAMMAARLSRPQREAATTARAYFAFSEGRWGQLRAVNRDINRSIRPSTDRALYGMEEFWQRPLLTSGAGARGDCEDYALEKRARLIALGWPADSLALAVAVAPRIGLHAVLLVQTDEGDFVLDNLHDEPRALSSLDYVWLSRQTGADLTNWAVAQVSGMPTRQFVDASAEDMFQRLMRERMSQPAAQLIVAEVAPLPAPSESPVAPVPQADISKPRREQAPVKLEQVVTDMLAQRKSEERTAQGARRSPRPTVMPSMKA